MAELKYAVKNVADDLECGMTEQKAEEMVRWQFGDEYTEAEYQKILRLARREVRRRYEEKQRNWRRQARFIASRRYGDPRPIPGYGSDANEPPWGKE